jgi:fumarate hydratase class I
MQFLPNSLLELITQTSTNLPPDVRAAMSLVADIETPDTQSAQALNIILSNVDMAIDDEGPICQDTGMPTFVVHTPVGVNQIRIKKAIREAVAEATRRGKLRPNSVDSLTGVNDGTNVGVGSPVLHFHQHRHPTLDVRLILKGGGCENVGAQYSLPNESLRANRDLDGCRKVILDAVLQAQGKGCGPGILGVCIGGDRATGYEFSKQQFLRTLQDRNPIKELDELERSILETANQLGIGPMGFGGRATLLGVKICAANRLPASFFVSVSYMCWAYRRQGRPMPSAAGGSRGSPIRRCRR